MKTLTTIELPAIPKFVATDHFKEGFYLLPNFKKHLLPKVEPKIKAETIRVSELTKGANDQIIRQELGKSNEISLSQLFELLKTADKNKWFISYIKDIKGEILVVYYYWNAGRGWCVGAFPVSYPLDWSAGSQVLSRYSSSPLVSDSQTLKPSESLPLVPSVSLAPLFTPDEVRKLKDLAKKLV